MTFRITRLEDAQGPVIKVDGWLQAEGLPDLDRELGQARGDPGAGLTLDLSGLRQADEAVLTRLRDLAASGARLTGCPLYLALRLAAPVDPA